MGRFHHIPLRHVVANSTEKVHMELGVKDARVIITEATAGMGLATAHV